MIGGMDVAAAQRRVALPAGLNPGLAAARQAMMLALLGRPRASFGRDCQGVTDPALKVLTVTEDLGPFRATGLRPAVGALRAIVADLARERPYILGMLCARHVRGSTSAISNYAWGTAIDLKVGSMLDTRGDGMVQAGLVAIAPIFNRRG